MKKLHFNNRKSLKWRSELPNALQWNRGNMENSCNYVFLHTISVTFILFPILKKTIYTTLCWGRLWDVIYLICDKIVDEIDVIVSGVHTLKGMDSRAIGLLLVICIVISISNLCIRFSILKDEKFEIEFKLKNFSRLLDHCSTI